MTTEGVGRSEYWGCVRTSTLSTCIYEIVLNYAEKRFINKNSYTFVFTEFSLLLIVLYFFIHKQFKTKFDEVKFDGQ